MGGLVSSLRGVVDFFVPIGFCGGYNKNFDGFLPGSFSDLGGTRLYFAVGSLHSDAKDRWTDQRSIFI